MSNKELEKGNIKNLLDLWCENLVNEFWYYKSLIIRSGIANPAQHCGVNILFRL